MIHQGVAVEPKSKGERKNMIEVTHLAKSYGNHHAVQDVSFQVQEGQIVGLLGPNGAGKSTTMNMMTGYLTPDSGTVLIAGADIAKEPDKVKRQIGYLPEIPPLYVDMTVEEYLKFVSSLKKIPKKEQKEEIERVCTAVCIEDKTNRLIKNLSKGYRQRVGFASALLGNPPVLILDEPTVGLDPNQIIEIRQLIQQLGKEHTVILSSHILSEVSAICDHIIIIDKGRVVAQDTPEGLSKAFSGKNELQMEVEGEEEAIDTALKECQWISSFTITKTEEEHIFHIKGQLSVEEDKRKDIFFHMVKFELPVYLLTYENLSLEEVFLKVTGEEELQNPDSLEQTEEEKNGERKPLFSVLNKKKRGIKEKEDEDHVESL